MNNLLPLFNTQQIDAELQQDRLAKNLRRPLGYIYKAPGSRARNYIPQRYAL